MKRKIAIILLMLLLCGCTREPPEPAVLTDTVPTTQAETEDVLISLSEPEQEGTAPEEAPVTLGLNGVQYSIMDRDDSIRNENGDVLVSIRYQQVILDNAQPEWARINTLIGESYRAFQEETAYLRDTPPEQWEQMLADMGAVYGNFMANCSARVTHNANGILSIRMHRDWFLGGVYNGDPFALNYDLTTGEKLSLARLSDLPEEEFTAQLKGIVCDYLAPDLDLLFGDPAVTLENYTLEDFHYCIEEGELILLFATYTFGPGSMGPTVIRTGIYPEL